MLYPANFLSVDVVSSQLSWCTCCIQPTFLSSSQLSCHPANSLVIQPTLGVFSTTDSWLSALRLVQFYTTLGCFYSTLDFFFCALAVFCSTLGRFYSTPDLFSSTLGRFYSTLYLLYSTLG